jgi:hypothetical protein
MQSSDPEYMDLNAKLRAISFVLAEFVSHLPDSERRDIANNLKIVLERETGQSLASLQPNAYVNGFVEASNWLGVQLDKL